MDQKMFKAVSNQIDFSEMEKNILDYWQSENVFEKSLSNKIYYGAPGCGKSYKVEKLLNEAGVEDCNRIRVTFYKEYSH